MKKWCLALPPCLMFFLLSASLCYSGTQPIRIGFNIPLSGWLEQVGSHARDAAELVSVEINKAGGVQVGNTKYPVKFIYEDNTSNPTKASSVAIDLITRQKVLAIVGPLSSQHAVPAGQMVNAFATPMIAPWSTSPFTTKDRPFVFRSGYLLEVQGPALTTFVDKKFKVTKAAVLYDIVSAYPRAVAKNFRKSFELVHGAGSVVAYEEFRTGEKDFRAQLKRIKQSGAEVMLAPQHYNEVPEIVHQAREVGLTIPIIGSNSWAGGDIVGRCKADCNGLFFVANYAPGGAKGVNKKFVTAYKAAYKELPDEPAALTWDAVRVVLQAVHDTGGLSGNIIEDRKMVRDSLAKVHDFEGASGPMTFNESGDPEKCAIIVQINGTELTEYEKICP